jgi:HD-like signal output (HDOD) protein
VPPVLPKVGLELITLSRSANVEIGQIVHLLEQDALIAAAVLRQAQSAYYARGIPIRSLHEAIVRLGLDTISDLFLAQSMAMRVFRANGYEEPMERLRAHGTATAHIARFVCRETAIYDEYAFLCGLLHDVGMAASLIVLASGRVRANVPSFEKAWPAVCDAHEEAGAALCTLWKLPADVAYVVGAHHQPRPGHPVHPLAAVVRIAESIASELGFGIDGDGSGNDAWATGAVSLSATARSAIITRAKELLDEVLSS